jgi:hypothetical protein
MPHLTQKAIFVMELKHRITINWVCLSGSISNVHDSPHPLTPSPIFGRRAGGADNSGHVEKL